MTRLAGGTGIAAAWQLARQAYWTARRDPAAAPHVARALVATLALLPRWAIASRLRRRPTLAIALVEHIGDIVAAEPIVRLARATYPRHRLVWVTRPAFRALAESLPAIDAVLTVPCLTGWQLLWQLGRFDVVWDLHLNRRDCPRCRVPLRKAGTAPLPEAANYLHLGSLLAAQCRCAGLPRLDDGPRLLPPSQAVTAVDRLALPTPFVVLHGRSNEASKDWRNDGWHALVARLLPAWDGAVVEVGLHPVAIPADTARTVNLCGRLSLLQTAEVIRRAALFVGIDSGPAHLANAVGTPGVVLLGQYRDFRSYTPFSGGYADGSRATLLRAAGPASELAVEAVFAAVMARLAAG